MTVTGNVLYRRGDGRARDGSVFHRGDDRKLKVVSTGNFIEGVRTHRLPVPT